MAVALFVALSCAPVSASEDYLHLRGRKIVLLALPHSLRGGITEDTRHLASTFADALRATGARVVLAGTEAEGLPMEGLAATANTVGADVAIGLRSLAAPGECAAIIVPDRVPAPSRSSGPVDMEQLPRFVAQLAASSKAEASANLKKVIGSPLRSCPKAPTKSERYLLDAIHGPTVILALGASDAAILAPAIGSLLEQWIAMEQQQ